MNKREDIVKAFRYFILFSMIVSGLMLIISSGSGDGSGTDGGINTGVGGNQTSSAIEGRVVDTSGSGIADVSVLIVNGNSTTSDSSGDFTVTADQGDGTIVVFSKQGYVSGSKSVNVYSGTTTSLQVALMPEGAPRTLNASTGGTLPVSKERWNDKKTVV